MIKKILIPVDGSEFFKPSLEMGLRLAKQTGAQLVGLAIIDEPEIMKSEFVPGGASEFHEHKQKKLMEKASELAEKSQAEFLENCKSCEHPPEFLIRTGIPAQVILEECIPCDLVIMGKEGYFKSITQRTAGETISDVLHKTPRPAILVPEEIPEAKNVLMGTDGSPGAARALQLFRLMGLAKGLLVDVIAVKKDQEEAKKDCALVESYLKSYHIRTTSHAIESSKGASGVILDHMEKEPYGMMVMGAYGKNGLKEVFIGSNTDKLIQKSKTPLFICH